MTSACTRGTRMKLRSFAKLATCLAALSLATGAWADDSSDPENPFGRGTHDIVSVSLGGFATHFNTTARVDSDRVAGSGTDIDLEDDTGLTRDRNDLRLDGYWRFARKHRLEFGVISISRDANRVINRTLEFGDTVFDVGGSITTEFNTDIYKLAYKYSFVRNPRIDAGISFGLSTYRIETSLSGNGTVYFPDGSASTALTQETKRVLAPIPALGGHADVKLGGNWYFNGSVEYLKVNVSGVEGTFTDARADFDWYPFEHFGFGGGYNWVRLTYTNISST